MEAEDLDSKLKAITDYVLECQRRVLRGEIMDLSGLDVKVIEICKEIASVPPPGGRRHEPPLQALVGHLDELARLMQDYQKKIG